MGKSLYVKRMANKLSLLNGNKPCHIIIPIHGPDVTTEKVVDFLCRIPPTTLHTVIIHFDIATKVGTTH